MTLLRGLYLEDMTAAGAPSGRRTRSTRTAARATTRGRSVSGRSRERYRRAAPYPRAGRKLDRAEAPGAASQSADLVNFVDNADTTRLLTVDKDGKLGIGVSTVLAKVHLKGASAADDTLFVEESASATKRVVVRSDGSVGFGLNYPTQSLTGRSSKFAATSKVEILADPPE
jgi:hypothetical protein